MKNCKILTRLMQLITAVLLTSPAIAAPINFPQAPIASLGSGGKPNILFILDDSASMLYTYMPEWAGKAPLCKQPSQTCSELDKNTNFTVCACSQDDAVFRSSDFNTLYYNPAFRYFPAINADGTYKKDMNRANTSNWESVPNDAYDVIINDKYNARDRDTSSTTNLASGTYRATYTKMIPGEYCTQPNLRDCRTQASRSDTHPYPAYVRFCSSIDDATSRASPAINKCQATVADAFTSANTRYPERGKTNAGNGAPGQLIQIDITTDFNQDKAPQRSDCASSRCTYDEEMTNYANWWAYYRTRLQTMKTSTSLAFANIDDTYRVGYNVINNDLLNESHHSKPYATPNKFLHIRPFDQTQKNAFYARLFAGRPSLDQSWQGKPYNDKYHYTPLRAALSHAGRYFAKKLSGQTYDAVQYSCQANFTILSTDGSWNKNDDFDPKVTVESDAFGPKALNGSANVGNLDQRPSILPPKREGAASKDSLADVAMYYADTDLRTSTLGNCIGANGLDVCGSSSSIQNMSTFTVGLGINGTLIYRDDYQTANSGDFYDITQGIKHWPSGTSCKFDNCPERVDDLWHAAVNGNGRYFSAQDPQQLHDGLSTALRDIYSRANTGGAAATTTLTPVAGNNSAYVTSYTSMEWTGNLESRSISTATGQISQAASWCVEDTASKVSASDGTENLITCQGTLKLKFPDGGGDTRNIYTNGKDGRVVFAYDNLTSVQQSYFKAAHWTANGGLSQWPSLTAAQKSLAEKNTLVNYLRGRATHEDKIANTTVANRLFRERVKTLGDITESAAVYVGAPNFNYLESSYSAFKTEQASRSKSVYVGANDGMMHAFNASDGTERWAYVPSMVLPNLWKLADKNYATKHQNFVNGTTTVSDVCSGTCSAASNWKTILVGGLNQGGKGFYALNVTAANDAPDLLWEFDTNDDADLGYSFGNPVITKMRDSGSPSGFKWVVLLSSGYNNTGVGHLYVLDAISGTLIRRISTGVGDAINPSGLAKISAFVARPSENNQADYVYGGDLLGNLWRFKIDSAASTAEPKNPVLLATLKDENGLAQPITARPELGKFGGQAMVFIGTGKYLEQTDLNTTQTQTLYAIKDNGSSILRRDLSKRSITNLTEGNSRIGATQIEDGKPGWYIDLPDSGERQVVSAKLASGTLVVPTMVPSTQACGSNGYGWINYFEARTGGIVSTTIANRIGTKTDAAPVGINILYIAGKPTLSVTADNEPTPQLDRNAPFRNKNNLSGKRASWRELIR